MLPECLNVQIDLWPVRNPQQNLIISQLQALPVTRRVLFPHILVPPPPQIELSLITTLLLTYLVFIAQFYSTSTLPKHYLFSTTLVTYSINLPTKLPLTFKCIMHTYLKQK